ncbi:MAG: hypothetical protein GY702_20720 [Desulfobulbaceae bacterium]|nr:hypothetical protein [Desulfobulbaceae bacterium]
MADVSVPKLATISKMRVGRFGTTGVTAVGVEGTAEAGGGRTMVADGDDLGRLGPGGVLRLLCWRNGESTLMFDMLNWDWTSYRQSWAWPMTLEENS